MGLKMKTFKTILNDMATWISSRNSKLNNFYVGSIIRTLLESVALEVESLYFQMYKGFRYAIENSIFHSFGFYKNPAIASSGNLTLVFKFPLGQELSLPKGYTFSTIPAYGDSVYFELSEDVILPKFSSEVSVPVKCTKMGVIGNVSAYSIRVATRPMSFVQNIYNPEAFTNGAEEETKEERKQRFSKFISTLSKGTISAIEYGCLKTPGITGVYVDESPGTVYVYAHDSSGNLSEELKKNLITNLVDYRAAGIELQVLPVVKKPVDLVITILLAPGFEAEKYKTLVQSSVSSMLNYYIVKKNLNRADIIKYIMTIDPTAIINSYISLEADIEVTKNEVIRAGTIEVIVG